MDTYIFASKYKNEYMLIERWAQLRNKRMSSKSVTQSHSCIFHLVPLPTPMLSPWPIPLSKILTPLYLNDKIHQLERLREKRS